MGRPLRTTAGGLVYHVLNRANARMQIYDKPQDYDAFDRILTEAVRRVRMRLLAYCVMPNHWHLVVWPREDGDLSSFVGWLTLTHTQRWHAHRHSVGSGHVYQGRFKSFLVESDEHLWAVCRYVERNALRAGLCVRAEEWRWSSLWRREYGDADCRAILSDWPMPMPQDWLRRVNRAQSHPELEALRRCANRGQPFGSEDWVDRMTKRFGLQSLSSGREAAHTKNPHSMVPDLLYPLTPFVPPCFHFSEHFCATIGRGKPRKNAGVGNLGNDAPTFWGH